VVRYNKDGGLECSQCVDTGNLVNVYNRAVGADKLWNMPGYLQGQGITVAIVDSGINTPSDLQVAGGGDSRLVASTTVIAGTPADDYGHGTHVAGIITGNGNTSSGARIGIAPGANLINVKVSDATGMSLGSDLVAGLQWVYDNRLTYNIKIVNISLNSTVAESYNTSAIDAAVEILWFNGIVVAVSAGNNGGPGAIYPPANDPFVITVGAADDMGTASLSDDVVTSFSAYGTTESGFAKPELVAPGRNLISLNASITSNIYINHAPNRVDNSYFRMSGTSMSAPVVTGAVALLLQDEPTLTPDQVKYRLMATANKTWAGYNATTAGAGYLDAYAAIYGTSTQTANTGILASQMLSTGSTPITWGSVGWNSVGWNSVGWNSVGWNSVGWNSVGWNSVGWNTDYWGP
jgi:serine protease AprX